MKKKYFTVLYLIIVWGRGEVHTGFWYGPLNEEDHLGDPVVDGTIISKWIFKKWDGGHGLY
jgi:hypothetical protein